MTTTLKDCAGCDNPVDLCICDELDFYEDAVESANTPNPEGDLGGPV